MKQKAVLKQLAFETEASNNISNADDKELQEKVVRLQAHIKDLETENNDLMEQLLPHVNAQKQAEKEAKELEEKMIEALAEAEVNMNNDGFFVDYSEHELIKDKTYLKEALQQEDIIQTENTGEIEEIKEEEISEEELETMLFSENMAIEAMALQGFYNEIQEETLVTQPLDEIDQIEDEDERLEKQLSVAQNMLANNPLYQDNIAKELLIENEELLEKKLAEIIVNPSSDTDSEVIIPSVKIEAEEEQQMEQMIALANSTMEMEGLYQTISEEKLVGAEESEVTVANQKMYTSELEQLVVDAIGKTIPPASAEQKDNLKKIDGIGMFVEEQLNHFGIYTFEQIEAFDADFINKLTAAIGFSTETIYRDKWVEQAKEIIASN